MHVARQFVQRGSQPPAALTVAGQQPVHLQSGGQPVRGRAGQAGAVAQLGQAARGLGDGMQHAHGFVENADAAILSHIRDTSVPHVEITRSEWRSRGKRPRGRWRRNVWDVRKSVAHLAEVWATARRREGEPDLIYIDLHLIHEVTSPQAFDGLRLPGARCAGPI